MNEPTTNATIPRETTPAAGDPTRLPRFTPRSPLRDELERRVSAHFEDVGVDPRGGGRLGRKGAVMVLWAVGSYLLLLLWAASPWTAVPLAVSLGLALAGIGFSVMHDGGHGASSRRGWINQLAAGSLDLIGGSSFFWRQKHNVLHHSFTNIAGADDDLDAGPFLRLSPHQPHRWGHRFQHLYEVLLLAVFAVKWTFVDDFNDLIRGRVGHRRLPRPRGRELAQLLGGKLFFFGWAVALPLLLHPVLPYLGVFALTAAVLGITLGLVFQLAHVVEETAFVQPPEAPARLERPWAEHQIATTADFAPGNRLVTWYVGGLNYQVEHHLFPRISHVHYPAVAAIVADVCREQGVPRHEHRTLRGALASHFRFLKRLGRPPAPAAAAA